MKSEKFQLGYFAHSMREYNSEKEDNEYEFISNMFYGFVICPNNHIGEQGDIQPYLDVITKVDVVYASEHQNLIGKGVFQECQLALSLKKPVFVVKKNKVGFYLEQLKSVEVINENNYNLYGSTISEKIT